MVGRLEIKVQVRPSSVFCCCFLGSESSFYTTSGGPFCSHSWLPVTKSVSLPIRDDEPRWREVGGSSPSKKVFLYNILFRIAGGWLQQKSKQHLVSCIFVSKFSTDISPPHFLHLGWIPPSGCIHLNLQSL